MLLALGGAALGQTSAAWDTLGPAGGPINALLTSPLSSARLYAGTPGNGVFVSDDAGATWAQANGGLAPSTSGRFTLTEVHALATDGQHVYAATGAGLFYTSASGTPAWSPMAGTGSLLPINFLAFDGVTSRLYAATNQTDGSTAPGVYVSDIDPSSAPAPNWSFNALPASPSLTIGSLAVVNAPGGATATAVMVGVGGRVYTAPIAPGYNALAWVDGDPNATLAAGLVSALAYSADFQGAYACSGGVAYRSGNALDAQPLWEALSVAATGPRSFNCSSFFSVPVSAGGAPTLVLGTDQGAFVSTGGTAFAATGRLVVSQSVNAFALASLSGAMASTLFMASGFGVASADAAALAPAQAWTASNGPASVAGGGTNQRLNNAPIVDTAVLGGRLYAAATSNDDSEVFVSSDGGATWQATLVASAFVIAGEEIVALVADPAYGVLYAASSQGLLAYSPGSGQWSAVGTSVISGRATALARGSAALFVATDDGVFALARSGNPAAAVPTAAGLTGSSVRSLLVSGGTLYAGTIDTNDENFVFASPESGAAAGRPMWTPFGVASAGTDRITGLLAVGNELLAATSGSLVLHASAGSAWTSANTSSDPAQQISDAFGVVTSLFSDGMSIYAATANNGVFLSPVNSFSWTPFSGSGTTALPSLDVRSLRADGTTLYAATRAGVAALGGITPTPPEPPAPTASATGSGGGGGAIGAPVAWLMLAACAALAALRYRDRKLRRGDSVRGVRP